jgi:hypothetical protein
VPKIKIPGGVDAQPGQADPKRKTVMSNRVRSNDTTPPWDGNPEQNPKDGCDVFSAPTCPGFWEEALTKKMFASVKARADSLGISLDEFIATAIVSEIDKDTLGPGSLKSGPKVHKNFFLINMSQLHQRELRALCARFGIELRLFFANAVRSARRELEQCQVIADRSQLDPNFVWRLTDAWQSKN